MATRETISEVLRYLAASYPLMQRDSTETVQARVMVYTDQLADIGDDLLRAAVRQVVSERESEYPPPVGLIRTTALRLASRATNDVDAMTAWGTVHTAASGLGRDASEDQLLAYFKRFAGEQSATVMMRIVKRLHWRDICNCDEAQLNTLRAQFRDAYNIEMNRERERQLMTPTVANIIGTIAARHDVNRLLSAGKDGER